MAPPAQAGTELTIGRSCAKRRACRLCRLRLWDMMSEARLDSEPSTTGMFMKDVRMRGFQERAEGGAVLRLLDERLRPVPRETILLPDAAGRVLAEDVIAPCAVPGFDRAAMDGYALR